MKKFLKRCLSAFLFVGVVVGTGLLSSCGSKKTSEEESTSTTAETTQLVITGDSEILVGGSTTLTVQCGGRNVSATLTSSDTGVATVNSSSGKVEGVKVGKATITAAAEGYISATHEISVVSDTQDITLSFTVKFESGSNHQSVQSGYSIYFASSLAWESPIEATLDGEVWKVTLDDVKFDQTIKFNTYYGTEANVWKYKNTEDVGNQARSLKIDRGTTSYPLESTFNVPNTVDSITYKITLSIGGSTETKLNDGLYVYVSTNTNEWSNIERAAYDSTLGIYTYEDKNVSIGWEEYRIVLGDANGCNWDYKYPADTGNSFEVKSESTEFEVTAEYATQPTCSEVTFKLNNTDSLDSSATKIVFDKESPLGVTKQEVVMTHDNGVYTYTAKLINGARYFYFTVTKDTDTKTIYTNSSQGLFTITVAGNMTATVTGTFTSGTGTLATEEENKTYKVTFGLLCSDSPKPSETQVVYDYGSTSPAWKPMSPVTESEYTFSTTLPNGTYTFYFYAWDDGTGTAKTIYDDSSSTKFSVTVNGEDIIIGIEGTFATGTGDIKNNYNPTVAYKVTFILNCDDSPNSDNTQVVYDTTSPLGDRTAKWMKMTAGTNQYTYSAYLAVGTYYFYFYSYSSEAHTLYAGASNALFSIQVVDADFSVTVTGTFASGLGTAQA